MRSTKTSVRSVVFRASGRRRTSHEPEETVGAVSFSTSSRAYRSSWINITVCQRLHAGCHWGLLSAYVLDESASCSAQEEVRYRARFALKDKTEVLTVSKYAIGLQRRKRMKMSTSISLATVRGRIDLRTICPLECEKVGLSNPKGKDIHKPDRSVWDRSSGVPMDFGDGTSRGKEPGTPYS